MFFVLKKSRLSHRCSYIIFTHQSSCRSKKQLKLTVGAVQTVAGSDSEISSSGSDDEESGGEASSPAATPAANVGEATPAANVVEASPAANMEVADDSADEDKAECKSCLLPLTDEETHRCDGCNYRIHGFGKSQISMGRCVIIQRPTPSTPIPPLQGTRTPLFKLI